MIQLKANVRNILTKLLTNNQFLFMNAYMYFGSIKGIYVHELR